jgi:hypothetical protein
MKQMHMKNITFLLLFILSAKISLAQDTIFKYNGDKVIAKITEINPTEIKYKKFDFQDGPTYVEKKSEIKMVILSSGLKEIFQSEEKKTTNSSGDYYGNNSNGNLKIEHWGARYRYDGKLISENQMQKIVLQTNDKKIMTWVGIAKDNKKLQYIGFAAIPLGVISLYSLAYGYSGSSNYKGLLTLSGVCFIGTVACPIISGISKHKRKEANNEAVRLYNQKF